jgi:putative glutamine amidotransferase
MKTLAISQQLLFDRHHSLCEIVDVNWGRFLDALNFSPLYLPIYYDFRKLHFDGVILTGGGDLHCISQKPEDKIRDDFEISLIKFSIENEIPLFGVCRGMQLINCYFCGTLKKTENHAGCKHKLSSGREVNSYHHYAVDTSGLGLEIVDTSLDGVIESVRHSSHAIFAQMHHPERNDPPSELDLELLKDFFHA